MQNTEILQKILSTRWRQFWQTCRKLFARRPIFLKYFHFSEKKLFFLTFFLEVCKVQFQQPGIPLIVLDHYFSLKVRQCFIVSCFFKKNQNHSWNTSKVLLETLAELFRQKPQFFISKSENIYEKIDSLAEFYFSHKVAAEFQKVVLTNLLKVFRGISENFFTKCNFSPGEIFLQKLLCTRGTHFWEPSRHFCGRCPSHTRNF